MSKILEEAIAYTERGWSVLPIRHGDKVPVTQHGKHDASCDPNVIANWFAQTNHNIGILTGEASGLLVVDVDPRNGGENGLASLQARYGDLPTTLRVSTGGGGVHYYYSLPIDVAKTRDRPNVDGFGGVDLKADGYVVAPPSIHSTGGRYEWLDGEIVEAPLWLIELASKKIVRNNQVRRTTSRVLEGGRNETLFRLACNLMRNGMDREAVVMAVTGHNHTKCEPPLDLSEIEAIVESAFRYEEEANAPINEVFNAERLVRLLNGDGRYEPRSKQWYVWEGTHWQRDDDGEIMRRAMAVTEALRDEAARIEDEDVRKKRMSAVQRSECHAQISNSIKLAAVASGIPVEFSMFDCKPNLLNVANGTIDLRTGELRPHSREDLITHLIEIEYDPDSSCPAFDDFLSQICSRNVELKEYLQTTVGYSATGLTSEQCFFILHGSGANGKSTFLNVIRAVLAAYAKHTPTETLLVRQSSASGNDLIRLAGARFVTASEASADQRMADGLLKQITGDEPITARYLFRDFVEFQPQFKLFLATNNLPQLDGTDPAIWRRVRTIPFDRVFAKDEQDQQLYGKLMAERPGILSWIVAGARTWFKSGLVTPTKVEKATLEYSKEMDPVGQFIDEFCSISSSACIPASNLFFQYTMFANDHGLEGMTMTRFGKILAGKGFGKEKRGGSIVRLGLDLAT